MAKIKKSVQKQDLAKYRVWINDVDPSSRYFRLSEIPEVLTGGKNAFLINGSPELVSSTELRVEIIDSDGNTVFLQPIRNYVEGLARVVSIEVYSDTAPGLATLTILGHITKDENGNLPPDEFVNSYNVRWQRQIVIAPDRVNTTPIRLYKRPIITARELLVPYRTATVGAKTVVNATGTAFDGIIQGGTVFTRQMIGGTFAATLNGLPFSSSIVAIFNSGSAAVALPFTGSYVAVPYSITYPAATVYVPTQLSRSFAAVDITNLTPFSGDIRRARISAKSLDQPGDFVQVANVLLETPRLTLTQSLSTAQQDIDMGYLSSQAIIDAYWNGGTIVNNGYSIGGVALVSDGAKLLDGLTFGNVSNSWVGLATPLTFVGDAEYTVSGTFYATKTDPNTVAQLDVYLVGAAFPSSSANPLGFSVGSIISPIGVSEQRFDNIDVNVIAENDGPAFLRFVATSGSWAISNVGVSVARESGFTPDHVSVVTPIVDRRFETLTFKAELFDASNNVVPINLESDAVFFDGGNAIIKGSDNKLSGTIQIASEITGQTGIILTAGGYTSSVGVPVPNSPAIYIGQGTYANANTPVFMASSSAGPLFSLGDALRYDGNILTIVGSIRQRPASQGGGTYADFVNRGNWAIGTVYYINDLVGYSGSTYYNYSLAHTASFAANPYASSSIWQLFAASGSQGTQSKLITLSATGQAFTFDSASNASPASQSITFTVSAQNITGGIVWSTNPSVTLTGTGINRNLAVADFGANNTVAVTATGDGVFDTITVYRLKSGGVGANGVDAYTMYLTNESQTLPADPSGSVTSYAGANTVIKVFQGISDITNLYTFTKSDSTGLTSTLSAADPVNPTVTVTNLTNAILNGYVDVTGSKASSPTLMKRMSLAKSLQGNLGPSGNSPAILKLISTGQLFSYDYLGNPVPTSQTIGFTGSLSNASGSVSFSIAPYISSSQAGNMMSFTAAAFGSTPQATVSVQSGSLSDYVTVYAIKGGASGSLGASGSNSIIMFLTNEATTLPADNAGNVTSFADAATGVRIFEGLNDVSNLWTITNVDTNVTSTVVGNGSSTPAVSASAFPTPNNHGFVDITATRGGFSSLTRRFSMTKALAGSTGAPGNTPPILTLTSTDQIFTFDYLGNAVPSSQTIGMTASLNISGAVSFSVAPFIPTTQVGNTLQLTVANFGTNSKVTVTVQSGSLSDYVTVYALKGGASGSAGPIGASGSNAVVEFLTNEATTLPADSAGNVLDYSDAATEIRVLEGATDVTNLWTVSKVDTNVVSSIVGNGSSTPAVSASSFPIGSNVGWVDITVTRSGYTSLTRRFSLAKSTQGPQGSAANGLFITATSQLFSFDYLGNPTPSTQIIGFTGSLNVSGSVSFSLSPFVSSSQFGNQLQMTVGAFGTNTSVTVKVQSGSLADFVTVYRLTGGASGSQGQSGSSPFVALLTNEAATVPADSGGNVSSFIGASTVMKTYEGINDASSQWFLTTTNTVISSSISGNQTLNPTISASAFPAANTIGWVDATTSRSRPTTLAKPRIIVARKSSSDPSAGTALPSYVRFTALGYPVTVNTGSTTTDCAAFDLVVIDCDGWTVGEHNSFILQLLGSGSKVLSSGNDSSTDYFPITSTVAAPTNIGQPIVNPNYFHPTQIGWATRSLDTDTGRAITGVKPDVNVIALNAATSSVFMTIELHTTGGGHLIHDHKIIGGGTADDTAWYNNVLTWLTGTSITKRFSLSKAIAGTAGVTGQAGATAVVLKASATGQIFTYDSTNTPVPSSQTIAITGSLINASGSVSFSISPFVTNTRSGNTMTLTAANFGSTGNALITITSGTLTDTISVFGVKSGAPGTNGTNGSNGVNSILFILTNEATTLPADSSGNVSSFADANTGMRVFDGITDVTNLWSFSKVDTNVTSTVVNNGTSNAGVSASAFPAGNNLGWVDITATRGGYPTLTQRFTLSKSTAGVNGSSGATGPQGAGVVFRGVYNAAVAYFHTALRRDIVQGSDTNYYVVNNTGKSGLTTWGDPAAASPDWQAFGGQFSSVATDILLAQNATITKGLVLGGISPSYGFIRSVSASFNSGNGIYVDGTGSFFVGNAASNYIKFDQTNLVLRSNNIKVDSTSNNGTLTLGGATTLGAGAGVYADGNNNFRVGNPAGSYLQFDGTNLFVTASQFTLATPTLKLLSTGVGTVLLGSATTSGSGAGIYMDGNGIFRAGDPAADYLMYSASILTLNNITSQYVSGTIQAIGVLVNGATQWDGANNKRFARGGQEGSGENTKLVTFSPPFQSTPLIFLNGGLVYEPRAMWGPTGSGAETNAFNTSLPTAEDLKPLNASNTGFVIRARLRQASSGVPRAGQFSGTALTGVGQTDAIILSSSMPATNETYTVEYNTSWNLSPLHNNTVSWTVSVEVDPLGTGVWTERGSVPYTQAIPQGGNNGGTTDDIIQFTESGLSSNSHLRLVFKSFSATGTPNTPSSNGVTVQGGKVGAAVANYNGVSWTTSVDSYASKTPDALFSGSITWKAIEK